MKRVMIAISLLPMFAFAQTAREEIFAMPEKAGGIYYAYPINEVENTMPPAGYEPFYASHYGRHGSRYLISDADYKGLVDIFDKAAEHNALTPLGADAKERLDSVWVETQGRGGELTPLGQRQHRAIAHRMCEAYPQIFAAEAEVTAASTMVMRCAHSMFAFIEGLKEANPSLVVTRESSQRHMGYLNYHSAESEKYKGLNGPYHYEYLKFEDEKTNPERLTASLFADSSFVRRALDPKQFMRSLFWVAVDMQNVETPVSFFDLFTPDELFDLWEVYNYGFYVDNSSYPLADGQHVDNAKNLLRNIVETADDYIANGKRGATLRFGHDGNIMPLTALLQFPGCAAYETNPYLLSNVHANYKISPMASNVQIIFFRNAHGDVIAKFMLNEREVPIPAPTDNFPFYKWDDARATLITLLETPSRTFIPVEFVKTP